MPTRILLTETQLKKALQTIVEQNEELLNRTVEEYKKETEKVNKASSSSCREESHDNSV